MQPHDFAISVTTEWNGWRSMLARLEDLRDVHWHQPTGAPWPMLHAYVSCTTLPGGAASQDCDHASAPQCIRVCVLRSHNVPTAYAEVMRRATTTLTPAATRQLAGGARA